MYYVLCRLSVFIFALLSAVLSGITTGSMSFAQDDLTPDSTNSISKANLKVLFTVFGIDNRTGDILGFITANNHTDYRIVKTTDLDHVGPTIGQFEIASNSSRVKVGDQYNACIVLLKSMQRDCIISYKLPSVEIEQVGFSVKSVGPF